MENQNFEIMKKTPDGIIILHMSTIKNNHTMYGSWDMRCDRQNFFVILDQLLSFYPSNNPKNQNFQEMKKHLKISSFYKSISKIMIIHCTVPEIRHVTDVIFIFHFGLFFALLHP